MTHLETECKQMGHTAYQNGLVRAPALDPAMKDARIWDGDKHSRIIKCLRAWLWGWDFANMENQYPLLAQEV